MIGAPAYIECSSKTQQVCVLQRSHVNFFLWKVNAETDSFNFVN